MNPLAPDVTNSGAPKGGACAPHLLVLAGALLAWLPLLGNDMMVADDFTYTGVLSQSGVLGFVKVYGFWRLSAVPAYALFLAYPVYYHCLVLATHLISALLLYHVVLRLYGNPTMAVVAGLIFGMMPFGYQAMTWLCVYPYVVAVTFFLANLLVLLQYQAGRSSLATCFLVSLTLSFLTALSNECLLFPVVLSGLVVWLDKTNTLGWFPRPLLKRFPLALAPVAGCLVWLALYYLFPGSNMQKHVVINPRAVLSVYFHQYSLVDVFGVWLSPAGRAFVFEDWGAGVLAGVLLCLAVFAYACARFDGEARPEGAPPGPRFTLTLVIAMLLGCSLIYVFAGGFSLDNRKKYPLIPVLVLGGCWLAGFAWKGRRPARAACLATMVIGALFAAVSSWMVIGVWKHQTYLHNKLADFICERKIQGDILVRWNPDLSKAWPTMTRTTGYRFDDAWVLNCAIAHRGGSEVTVGATPHPTLIEYDPKALGWTIVSR